LQESESTPIKMIARQAMYIEGDTKKRELLKNPNKIEEIQQKNFIDTN
jgi:hypothetical protein